MKPLTADFRSAPTVSTAPAAETTGACSCAEACLVQA